MKFIATILFTAVSFIAFAQSIDEEKLTVTMKEFHQALVQKNTVSISRQTDEALSYGHSNGWVETKADMIKDLETGYITYQKITEDSILIVMNGDMASVRFLANVEATMKGTATSFRLRVLEVWAKKSKRWVLFARQAVKG